MKFNDYLKNNKIDPSEQDFDFEVSNLITIARLEAGLTQEALAKLMGTKQPSIARIENGKSLPTLSFLKKVAKAVNMTLIAPKLLLNKPFIINPSINSSTVNNRSPYITIYPEYIESNI